MVVLQTYLGSIDGATALSIGWHLSVVGQLYEQDLWDQRMLNRFAEDIKQGALVNRAVSEAETGSPTRGVDRLRMRLKKVMYMCLMA